MIYLRFLTERWSIESRIIRFGTRWWPSHVEFIDSETMMCLGSRLEGGVQSRPSSCCRPTREEWWSAPGIEHAWAMAQTKTGCEYDWVDILGFALARDWHQEGHYICSELVDWAFKQAGTPLTNVWMPSHRVSPRDLLVSPRVSFIRRL